MDRHTLLTVAVVLLVGLHGVAGTATADPSVEVSRATVADEDGSVTKTLTYEFTAQSNTTVSVDGQMTDGDVTFEFAGWESLTTARQGTSSSWTVQAGNSYRVTYEVTIPETASGSYYGYTASYGSPAREELSVEVEEPQFGYVSTQETELVFQNTDQASTTLSVDVPNNGDGLMMPTEVTFPDSHNLPDGFGVDYSGLPSEIQGGGSGSVSLDLSADSSVEKGTYEFTARIHDNLGNTLDVPVEVTVRKPPVLEAGENGQVDLGDVLVGSDKTVNFEVSEVAGYTGIDGVDPHVTQSDQYGELSFDGLSYLSTEPGGSEFAEATVSVDDSADQHSQVGFTAHLAPENGNGVGQTVTFTGRVIYPPTFGDVTMSDASLVFDQPKSEVDSYEKTVTVEVPNTGDQTMNVQGVTASIDGRQVSASVTDYDRQIQGQNTGEVTVEITAPPGASEGDYSLAVQVNAQDAGTETVRSSVSINHEVALSVERTTLGFGDVIVTENLTQSTDVAEALEYEDVTGLTVTKVSGPDQWLTVVERPPARLTAGDAAPFVVAVQFDTAAELYREYTWEFRVNGDDIDSKTVTVTATPKPVSLEGIRSPLAEYAGGSGWQAETATGMVQTLDSLESKLRGGGDVSRSDLSTGIAAGRATILFIESVENATGTLESEGNEAAQPEVVKATATYNLVDSYVSNLDNDELRATADQSRTAAEERVDSLVEQQQSYYEQQLSSDDVTMVERAHIKRQLAQLASLQGDSERAARLRNESAAAFENYTATVQQGNDQRQQAREIRDEARDELFTVVFGQPLVLNPAKWDTFETKTSESLAAYDDARSSFATAGASEEAGDVADERSEAASRFQFARYSMYASAAVYALLFLGLVGYLARNTYAYVRDAREAVSGDFLVAS